MELLKLLPELLLVISDRMTLASLYAFFCTCKQFADWSDSDDFWIRRGKILFGINLSGDNEADDKVMFKETSDWEECDAPETKRGLYLILHHVRQLKVYSSMKRDIAPDLKRDLHRYPAEEAVKLARGLMETDTWTNSIIQTEQMLWKHVLSSRSKVLIKSALDEYHSGHILVIDTIFILDLPWVYRRKLKKILRREILHNEEVKETNLSSFIDAVTTAFKTSPMSGEHARYSRRRISSEAGGMMEHIVKSEKITQYCEIFSILKFLDTLWTYRYDPNFRGSFSIDDSLRSKRRRFYFSGHTAIHDVAKIFIQSLSD